MNRDDYLSCIIFQDEKREGRTAEAENLICED